MANALVALGEFWSFAMPRTAGAALS